MGFMDSFLRKKTSGSTAKDRLKLVLVSDRANCSPETMEFQNTWRLIQKDWIFR